MEVILREHVDNLGRRGEIVKVAEGYARNYLLPRKLALAVNEANKRQIERERAVAEARDAEERSGAEALAPAHRRGSTSRSRAASARTTRCTGRSRPPTSPRRFTRRDSTSRSARSRCTIRSSPIGEHVVPVKIHRDVTAQVKVKVVPETAVKLRTSNSELRRGVRTSVGRVFRPGMLNSGRAASQRALFFDVRPFVSRSSDRVLSFSHA